MSDVNGFYFKTKVVLVDDNQSFLDNLSLKLSDKQLVDTYSDPFEALEAIHLNARDSIFRNPSDLITEIDANEEDASLFSIDFNKLQSLVSNPNKYHTIGVVIVDYSMPLLNGIEFCKRLSDLPVIKIMLTGHADFKLAVDALNKGIIDKFLIKDSDYMLSEIMDNIALCQKQLFLDCSNTLITHLPATKHSLIHSNEYKSYFNQISEELSIDEYYLVNAAGTYLLISENGVRYYFLGFEDSQLEGYLDIAQNANIDSTMIEKIKSKTHAPILIKDLDYKIPASDWNCLLHPIELRGTGYYCVIPEQTDVVQLPSMNFFMSKA